MRGNYEKVLVIGCPGSGKSTFSKALHAATGLPLYHLDNLYWNTDRTTVEAAVFRARLDAVLRKEAWIVDGNYASTMELRMQACDTVIFLDYPTQVCLDGIRARRGTVRSDLPWAEPEETDAALEAYVAAFSSQGRPQVTALLETYAQKTCLVFRSREEAAVFLAQQTEKGGNG